MQARRHPGPDAVITHARPSRSVDRNRRTRNYMIAMGLRIACFIGLVAIPIPGVRIAMAIGAAFEARPQVGDHLTVRDDED